MRLGSAEGLSVEIPRWPSVISLMALFPLLFPLARSLFAPRLELMAEILAFRQQLAILNRTTKRPSLRFQVRLFWTTLSRFWRDWRSALLIVKPETAIKFDRDERRVDIEFIDLVKFWPEAPGRHFRYRHMSAPGAQELFLRHATGGAPTWRLNARLKAASDSYPTRSATSAIGRPA
jgi:hypothetical protein